MMKNRIDKRGVMRILILITSGFLLSRVILPGGVIPLGYGFFAASLEHNISSILTGIFVCLGAVSTGFNARSMIVVISVLAMATFKIIAGSTKKPAHRMIPFFVSGMIASAAVIAVNGFVWYDLLMAVIQNLIGLVSYFIFQGALRAFSSGKGKLILTEDISSIVITGILCVFGFPQISVFGINLRNVIGIFLIVVFSYKGSYGLLARMGKWGTCAGVAICSISITVMLGSPENVMPLLWDVLTADALFFLVPERFLDQLKLPGASNLNMVVEKANYADEMAAMMVGRLEGFSQSYAILAKSFAKFAKGEEKAKKESKILTERVQSRVCEKCDMAEFCWRRSRLETWRAFLELCESLERNGKVVWDHVPPFFQEECEKPEAVLTEVRVGYEISRVEKIWMQRLAESKEVYAMQLGSLANAAHNLAAEMKSDVKLLVKLSEELETEFKKSGYKEMKASVVQNRFGKFEVTLDYAGPVDGGISRIINNVIKKKMVMTGELKYMEANRLKIVTGAANIAKHPGDISGDSYTFINSSSGCFSAILCDGMGTGKKAREQSGLAIRMMENFTYNGFDNQTAIEMINSALVMKSESEEDSYSTLDLVSINLQNGNMELLKYGGMPTVIKYRLKEEEYSGQRQYLPTIESISSNTLPVGIMNKVSSRTVKKKVCAGDCIIMMTDGIFDVFRQGGKSGGDLIRFIELLDCKKPQEMADRILQESLDISAGSYQMAAGESAGNGGNGVTPPDDMTVLVMLVEEE